MTLPAPIARVPWPIWAALASAAMLATAHAFQHFGYQPCNLCLRQREAYWGALVVAGAGLALVWLKRLPLWAVSLMLGGVFAAGAMVAAFHAGVEWKWFPVPQACASIGGGAVEVSDLMAILDGAKLKPPGCEEAAWRMLGLSMAGWNALVSAGLAAIGFLAARGGRA